MKKRFFLTSAAALVSSLPVASWAADPTEKNNKKLGDGSGRGPVLLTVSGQIGRANRKAFDPALDQMAAKHGVQFEKAFALTAFALRRLPAVTIKPTLEYDQKAHALSGPLLTTVLEAAGVSLKKNLQLSLRAVDGYNVNISLADVQAYKMMIAMRLDGEPMALGGLGPQWAVYDADRLDAFKDKPVNERFQLCPWGLYHIHVSDAAPAPSPAAPAPAAS
jgi:hypothetical protein